MNVWHIEVRLVLAWLAIIVLTGCDDKPTDRTTTDRRLPAGNSTVYGSVMFTGTPPTMQEINNKPCHEGAGPIREETVIVNENGTLRNVFVFVQGVTSGDGTKRMSATLDQKNCRYEPHCLGVQTNQQVVIRSSDPVMHNVHLLASQNLSINVGLTGVDDSRTKFFGKPEIMRLKCDVHPWMTGYMGVFENPWFAVTGDNGQFDLTGLPAGKFTLVAWHEQFGQIEKTIEVRADASMNVSFEFKQ